MGGDRPGAADPARETPAARCLEGELSCLTAFELLQVLQFLGKSGELSLRRKPGDEARCGVSPRGLVDLECGALREREAALAFSWWQEGSFRFELCTSGAAARRPEALPVQEVLMEAVRLADEIEARAGIVPERGEPLVLLREALRPDLEGVASAPEIVRFLGERPGATRRDLEVALPFAPVTLGFALARLCEDGHVGVPDHRLPDGGPPRRASAGGRARRPLLDGVRAQDSTSSPASKPD
jgi:hypothetical protein